MTRCAALGNACTTEHLSRSRTGSISRSTPGSWSPGRHRRATASAACPTVSSSRSRSRPIVCAGAPSPRRLTRLEAGSAVTSVDRLHVGDGVVDAGRERLVPEHGAGEGPQLEEVGRLAGDVSFRTDPPERTETRPRSCGVVVFRTRSSPSEPSTRAPMDRSRYEAMDAVMRPVRPSANRASARTQPVDAGRGQLRRRRRDLGLGAGERPELVQRVAAHVHQRAAGEAELPADVAWEQERDAHPRLHVPDARPARRIR